VWFRENFSDVTTMKGKYYGVYDFKNGEMCVGVFESASEIYEFFRGITKIRV